MVKKDELNFRLSYESDGKMGDHEENLTSEENSSEKIEDEAGDFFNITPDSE
ncbi:hypothetical protein SM124_18730 [Bacillus sp. 31A1R]|uniref:Uncharacterized protein n=1 Tax=Robertmurraya mangrovi TaxID=3098077 RepID=A0ABU5J2V8_9BACI|nr:hypothetical protein [Bacillus sp. 31A1R]MDZ5473757.1 hypothetical protein [Bacillus sp. 31A1R]